MAVVKSKNQREVILSTLRGKYHDITNDKEKFAVGMLAVSIDMSLLKNECYKKCGVDI